MLLSELRRTWELGAPKGPVANVADVGLERERNFLNGHAFRMHQELLGNGLTPYEVIGQLARIQRSNGFGGELNLRAAEEWNAEDRRERLRLVREVARWIETEGKPSSHGWWCVGLESILPVDAERISRKAGDLSARLREVDGMQKELARDLETEEPQSIEDFDSIATRAERISTAPPIEQALGAPEWETTPELRHLVDAGHQFEELNETLQGCVAPARWGTETGSAYVALSSITGHLSTEWLAKAARLHVLAPQVIAAAYSLRTAIGLATECADAAYVRQILEIGRHIAGAPPAAPETFRAAVWDHGVERAMDLVDAITRFEAAQQKTSNRISGAAWDVDCRDLRQTLASYGRGLFRWFNPNWRRANRMVMSFLCDPETPLKDVLELLDSVAEGQKAREVIRQGDGFGVAAFGQQWRGERSSSALLRAMAEWARSLGPRSREVRELASRILDAAPVRVCVSCLETVWAEFEPLLGEVSIGLGFAENPEDIGFDNLSQRTNHIVAAETVCREVFLETPKLISERVKQMGELNRWRQIANQLSDSGELGRRCFGKLWNGVNSKWSELARALEWVEQNRDIRLIAAKYDRPQEIAKKYAEIGRLIDEAITGVTELFGELQLDVSRLFGSRGVRNLSLSELISRLDRWTEKREDLSKWVAYAWRVKRAREAGIGDAVDRLETCSLDAENAVIELERSIYLAVLRSVVREHPDLARFDGTVHQGHVDEFTRLEEEHRTAARTGAMRAHYQRLPHGGAGPVGVLKAEIARRRGHMQIRQLMSHAGAAIQALKPVLMMSPLSVAQFLTPGEMKFDLLVMDEASQIEPVDALGAIARCAQAVVVGDERQLPPTRFFARMTGSQLDEDDADEVAVADVESILGLFLAKGALQRTLRWHYRSEHHSLIAVSNREFYESKLCILPSPYTNAAGRGIRFHLVREGVYDAGNTRTNLVEAKRVAEAVMSHARLHPGQTLGVGTFSAAQRRVIIEQLELLRRAEPEAESFFASHPHEPFFVKNLENIQGDERDVVFISVGYARDPAGQMSMRFGPLSNRGGERRLNVLISRARRRCEVFSSITEKDIDTTRVSATGVASFKLFLRFAETGQFDERTVDDPAVSTRVLEEDIANALRSRGYEVNSHVGISGAFIDVAVMIPERPDRYLIGIECDGPSYALARSSRDRDRLRREALERQGWMLHRVWGMDWYQRPAEQLERIIIAIEEAKERWTTDLEDERRQQSEGEMEREEHGDVFAGVPNDWIAYVESLPAKPEAAGELLETHIPALAAIVREIVSVEGPIHQDEVTIRVRNAWGIQRTGTRIQEHIAKAIRNARMSFGVERDGKFLHIAGSTVSVRNRSKVVSRSLRLPEMLPPAEIRTAITDVIRDNFGAREDEIVSTVLRRLGYATSGASFCEVVETVIRKMRSRGEIHEQGELLILAEAATK
jgi:very-short-patch-repair endonuclease